MTFFPNSNSLQANIFPTPFIDSKQDKQISKKNESNSNLASDRFLQSLKEADYVDENYKLKPEIYISFTTIGNSKESFLKNMLLGMTELKFETNETIRNEITQRIQKNPNFANRIKSQQILAQNMSVAGKIVLVELIQRLKALKIPNSIRICGDFAEELLQEWIITNLEQFKVEKTNFPKLYERSEGLPSPQIEIEFIYEQTDFSRLRELNGALAAILTDLFWEWKNNPSLEEFTLYEIFMLKVLCKVDEDFIAEDVRVSTTFGNFKISFLCPSKDFPLNSLTIPIETLIDDIIARRPITKPLFPSCDDPKQLGQAFIDSYGNLRRIENSIQNMNPYLFSRLFSSFGIKYRFQNPEALLPWLDSLLEANLANVKPAQIDDSKVSNLSNILVRYLKLIPSNQALISSTLFILEYFSKKLSPDVAKACSYKIWSQLNIKSNANSQTILDQILTVFNNQHLPPDVIFSIIQWGSLLLAQNQPLEKGDAVYIINHGGVALQLAGQASLIINWNPNALETLKKFFEEKKSTELQESDVEKLLRTFLTFLKPEEMLSAHLTQHLKSLNYAGDSLAEEGKKLLENSHCLLKSLGFQLLLLSQRINSTPDKESAILKYFPYILSKEKDEKGREILFLQFKHFLDENKILEPNLERMSQKDFDANIFTKQWMQSVQTNLALFNDALEFWNASLSKEMQSEYALELFKTFGSKHLKQAKKLFPLLGISQDEKKKLIYDLRMKCVNCSLEELEALNQLIYQAVASDPALFQEEMGWMIREFVNRKMPILAQASLKKAKELCENLLEKDLLHAQVCQGFLEQQPSDLESCLSFWEATQQEGAWIHSQEQCVADVTLNLAKQLQAKNHPKLESFLSSISSLSLDEKTSSLLGNILGQRLREEAKNEFPLSCFSEALKHFNFLLEQQHKGKVAKLFLELLKKFKNEKQKDYQPILNIWQTKNFQEALKSEEKKELSLNLLETLDELYLHEAMSIFNGLQGLNVQEKLNFFIKLMKLKQFSPQKRDHSNPLESRQAIIGLGKLAREVIESLHVQKTKKKNQLQKTKKKNPFVTPNIDTEIAKVISELILYQEASADELFTFAFEKKIFHVVPAEEAAKVCHSRLKEGLKQCIVLWKTLEGNKVWTHKSEEEISLVLTICQKLLDEKKEKNDFDFFFDKIHANSLDVASKANFLNILKKRINDLIKDKEIKKAKALFEKYRANLATTDQCNFFVSFFIEYMALKNFIMAYYYITLYKKSLIKEENATIKQLWNALNEALGHLPPTSMINIEFFNITELLMELTSKSFTPQIPKELVQASSEALEKLMADSLIPKKGFTNKLKPFLELLIDQLHTYEMHQKIVFLVSDFMISDMQKSTLELISKAYGCFLVHASLSTFELNHVNATLTAMKEKCEDADQLKVYVTLLKHLMSEKRQKESVAWVKYLYEKKESISLSVDDLKAWVTLLFDCKEFNSAEVILKHLRKQSTKESETEVVKLSLRVADHLIGVNTPESRLELDGFLIMEQENFTKHCKEEALERLQKAVMLNLDANDVIQAIKLMQAYNCLDPMLLKLIFANGSYSFKKEVVGALKAFFESKQVQDKFEKTKPLLAKCWVHMMKAFGNVKDEKSLLAYLDHFDETAKEFALHQDLLLSMARQLFLEILKLEILKDPFKEIQEKIKNLSVELSLELKLAFISSCTNDLKNLSMATVTYQEMFKQTQKHSNSLQFLTATLFLFRSIPKIPKSIAMMEELQEYFSEIEVFLSRNNVAQDTKNELNAWIKIFTFRLDCEKKKKEDQVIFAQEFLSKNQLNQLNLNSVQKLYICSIALDIYMPNDPTVKSLNPFFSEIFNLIYVLQFLNPFEKATHEIEDLIKQTKQDTIGETHYSALTVIHNLRRTSTAHDESYYYFLLFLDRLITIESKDPEAGPILLNLCKVIIEELTKNYPKKYKEIFRQIKKLKKIKFVTPFKSHQLYWYLYRKIFLNTLAFDNFESEESIYAHQLQALCHFQDIQSPKKFLSPKEKQTILIEVLQGLCTNEENSELDLQQAIQIFSVHMSFLTDQQQSEIFNLLFEHVVKHKHLQVYKLELTDINELTFSTGSTSLSSLFVAAIILSSNVKPVSRKQMLVKYLDHLIKAPNLFEKVLFLDVLNLLKYADKENIFKNNPQEFLIYIQAYMRRVLEKIRTIQDPSSLKLKSIEFLHSETFFKNESLEQLGEKKQISLIGDWLTSLLSIEGIGVCEYVVTYFYRNCSLDLDEVVNLLSQIANRLKQYRNSPIRALSNEGVREEPFKLCFFTLMKKAHQHQKAPEFFHTLMKVLWEIYNEEKSYQALDLVLCFIKFSVEDKNLGKIDDRLIQYIVEALNAVEKLSVDKKPLWDNIYHTINEFALYDNMESFADKILFLSLLLNEQTLVEEIIYDFNELYEKIKQICSIEKKKELVNLLLASKKV